MLWANCCSSDCSQDWGGISSLQRESVFDNAVLDDSVLPSIVDPAPELAKIALVPTQHESGAKSHESPRSPRQQVLSVPEIENAPEERKNGIGLERDSPRSKPSFICSALLRQTALRVVQSLKSPQLAEAVSLANAMSGHTNENVILWANERSMVRIDTISFFPLMRPQGGQKITVCVVKKSSAQRLCDEGYACINKYNMTFLPMDAFDWGLPTHAAFIEKQYFPVAAGKLTELGLLPDLQPMIMFKGDGLLLKYHMQQPELTEGTENPHMLGSPVWTISVTDDKPPEVMKIGMKDGVPLVCPWNPNAADVCIQDEEDVLDNWVQIKDADFSACHFACEDAKDFLTPVELTPIDELRTNGTAGIDQSATLSSMGLTGSMTSSMTLLRRKTDQARVRMGRLRKGFSSVGYDS